jgi:hypothetical protein
MSTTATFLADNEIVVVENLPFKLDDQGTLWIACSNIDDFVIDEIEVSDDGNAEYQIEITDAHLAKARELMTYDLVAELEDATSDNSNKPYAWMVDGYEDSHLASLTSDDILKAQVETILDYGIQFDFETEDFEEIWKIYRDTTDYNVASVELTELIDNAKLTQVMTASEAAEEFGISRQAVHDAINAGRIISRQSGQTHLILRTHAEKLWKKFPVVMLALWISLEIVKVI